MNPEQELKLSDLLTQIGDRYKAITDHVGAGPATDDAFLQQCLGEIAGLSTQGCDLLSNPDAEA